jgi:hypothetical protein
MKFGRIVAAINADPNPFVRIADPRHILAVVSASKQKTARVGPLTL